MKVRDVIRRIAGSDAVIVGGIFLRLGEGLIAAFVATAPERKFFGLAVIRAYQRFRGDGSFMYRAVAPISYFLRVADGPGVGRLAGRANILGGRCLWTLRQNRARFRGSDQRN